MPNGIMRVFKNLIPETDNKKYYTNFIKFFNSKKPIKLNKPNKRSNNGTK